MKKKNTQTPLATAKKHWIVYIAPTLITIAGLALMASNNVTYEGSGAFLALVGLGWILKKANEKWYLTESHLVMEKGILPWSKKSVEVPVKELYKTEYEPVRIKKPLPMGTISTRRRADNCAGFRSSFMAYPERFSQQVEYHLKRQPEHSLNQLFELKEKGAISEHEFNIMKLGHVTKMYLS